MMHQQLAHDLCRQLVAAESEAEVVESLRLFGLWDDPALWRAYGDRENNFSIIGNQQSNPAAALVEKLVNAVDAVLMREVLLDGIEPEGPQAPGSIQETLERYFDIPGGSLENITSHRRQRLSEDIGLVATGTKYSPNYLIFDRGEGQTPDNMPDTLLSLAASNKIRIPFVQGKFNMGGSGVLQFCGTQNLQLVVSRRHPMIDADPAWGFTLVRREDPGAGRRSSMFTYLAPEGSVPRFEAASFSIPVPRSDAPPIEPLKWGTIIKLYEYEMTGMKTHIRLGLFDQVNALLPGIGLPVRFCERRDYEDESLDATMSGLLVRLSERPSEKLERGYPTHARFEVLGEEMHAAIYAFKKGRAENYRRKDGVLFTINGQTHGALPETTFRRSGAGMHYLADSLLVIVDCSRISGRAREDLFMNSRDRLRSGELAEGIKAEVDTILHKHKGLRGLKARRRRQEIENRLEDARPLRDVLGEIIGRSPSLTALLIEGHDVSNPFRLKSIVPEAEFEGVPHPTFFVVRPGEAYKMNASNLPVRVRFATDADNDYFGRARYPGTLLLVAEGEIFPYSRLSLLDGTATLVTSLPTWATVGEKVQYTAIVNDPARPDPFVCEFVRHITAPQQAVDNGPGGEPRKEVVKEGRLIPEGLALPIVVEVKEEDWPQHGFDRSSALTVKGSGDGTYDFFVNVDNVYLKTEQKNYKRQSDPALLEARFKFALVLIGMALLEDHGQHENGSTPVEEHVEQVTRAVAPFLIPMIDSLGSLDPEDIVD